MRPRRLPSPGPRGAPGPVTGAGGAPRIRALAELTASPGELADLGEVREVAGRLELLAHELPSLCEQLARFLIAGHEDGLIPAAAGDNPGSVPAEVADALSAAGRAADMVAAALAEARNRMAAMALPPAGLGLR